MGNLDRLKSGKMKQNKDTVYWIVFIILLFLLCSNIYLTFMTLKKENGIENNIILSTNPKNITIYDYIYTIHKNCGSSFIVKCLDNNKKLCIFKEVKKGKYKKNVWIPLEQCLKTNKD